MQKDIADESLTVLLLLLDYNVWREGFVFGRLWCSFDNGCLEWHLIPQQGNSCSYLKDT